MSQIEIYKTKDGETQIDVKFEEETVWLNQYQLADLFEGSRTNIVEHIKHIYKEGELDEKATCRKFRQVRKEGKREVERNIDQFNQLNPINQQTDQTKTQYTRNRKISFIRLIIFELI